VRRAAFVDRDGVINELIEEPDTGVFESPLRPQDVKLMPHAAEALRRLKQASWLLVGVSNQPAAAKGTVSLEQLQAVQARVLELLAAEHVSFDAFEICWHHPDGVISELSGPCECRKPAPGMLLRAARELGVDLDGSWMIGDTAADVLAGRAAGCHTVLVENHGSVHKRRPDAQPEAVVPTLDQAVEVVLRPD
jgi:D-glycero-D-manno-heptose 1,7-bisphosphate phosphatase